MRRDISLPGQDPVFGSDIHRRPFRNCRIGPIEFPELGNRMIDPDIRRRMGIQAAVAIRMIIIAEHSCFVIFSQKP